MSFENSFTLFTSEQFNLFFIEMFYHLPNINDILLKLECHCENHMHLNMMIKNYPSYLYPFLQVITYDKTFHVSAVTGISCRNNEVHVLNKTLEIYLNDRLVVAEYNMKVSSQIMSTIKYCMATETQYNVPYFKIIYKMWKI